MTLPLLLLLAFVGPVIAVGAVVVMRAGRGHPVATVEGWGRRGLVRLGRARGSLITELGPMTSAVLIGLAGLAAVVAICWPAGEVASSVEVAVDRPFFAWTQQIYASRSGLATVAATVTQMGDLYPLVAFAAGASVIFAILWRRRSWWVPPLLLFGTLAVEVTIQRLLKVVVDRGHPPTALGTYPSGGIARVLALGGVVVFLVVLTWPQLSARKRALLWATVALLAAIEGFTRIYLLQHWLSDLFGGWLFGLLLLLTVLAAASALTARATHGDPIGAAVCLLDLGGSEVVDADLDGSVRDSRADVGPDADGTGDLKG